MSVGGGEVVDRAGLDVADPQPGAVRGGEKLDVPAELGVSARVPQVGASLGKAGHPIAADEDAVENDVAGSLGPAAGQDLVRVRCALGEHVDTLVQVPVAGGLGDPASRARRCTQLRWRNQRGTSTAWRNGPSAGEPFGVPIRRRWAASSRARSSTTWRGTSSVAAWVTNVRPLGVVDTILW